MKSIGILWNSMNNFRESAFDDIREYAKIEEVLYIDFGEQFRPFIKSLYPFDGRHKGLDDYKADIMVDQYESNEICILFLDVKDSEKEYIERKRVYVYKNIEELKQLIRNKYKDQVDNYNFDNVFHMADDEKEYLFTLKILSEYLKNYSIENQKVKKLLEV